LPLEPRSTTAPFPPFFADAASAMTSCSWTRRTPTPTSSRCWRSWPPRRCGARHRYRSRPLAAGSGPRAARTLDAPPRPLPRRKLLLHLEIAPAVATASSQDHASEGRDMRIAIYPGSFDPITSAISTVATASGPPLFRRDRG
jgi:hypothetical protein